MTSAPTSPDARALDRLGPAYEAGLDPAHRHAIGAFYTPSSVAERLVGLATRGVDLAPPRRPTVCDPAVGGGVFLLAAARRLEAHGHDRATVVADLVWGTDIDPEAVAVTRATLEGWAAEGGVRAEARHVVVADSLAVGPAAWPDRPATGFDLVVGNPPFQSQLGRDTARRPAQLARLRARLGPVVTPYVDSAALFLVEACRAVAPAGTGRADRPPSGAGHPRRRAGAGRGARGVRPRRALVGRGRLRGRGRRVRPHPRARGRGGDGDRTVARTLVHVGRAGVGRCCRSGGRPSVEPLAGRARRANHAQRRCAAPARFDRGSHRRLPRRVLRRGSPSSPTATRTRRSVPPRPAW